MLYHLFPQQQQALLQAQPLRPLQAPLWLQAQPHHRQSVSSYCLH